MNGFPFIFAYDTVAQCQYYCEQLPLRTAISGIGFEICAECFGVHYTKDDDDDGGCGNCGGKSQ